MTTTDQTTADQATGPVLPAEDVALLRRVEAHGHSFTALGVAAYVLLRRRVGAEVRPEEITDYDEDGTASEALDELLEAGYLDVAGGVLVPIDDESDEPAGADEDAADSAAE